MKLYLMSVLPLLTTLAAQAQQDHYTCREVNGVQIRLSVSESKDISQITAGNCADQPYGDDPVCTPSTVSSFESRKAVVFIVTGDQTEAVDVNLVRFENDQDFSGFTGRFQLSLHGDSSGYRLSASHLLPESEILTTYCSEDQKR
jgi:hypothetical protein